MTAQPYSWQELKMKWERDALTNEQAIGQLMVWGETSYTQLVLCQRLLESRQRQIEELLARVAELERRGGSQQRI